MPVQDLFQNWCFSLVFLPKKWGSTRQASLPVPAEVQPWPTAAKDTHGSYPGVLSCEVWRAWCAEPVFQLQHSARWGSQQCQSTYRFSCLISSYFPCSQHQDLYCFCSDFMLNLSVSVAMGPKWTSWVTYFIFLYSGQNLLECRIPPGNLNSISVPLTQIVKENIWEVWNCSETLSWKRTFSSLPSFRRLSTFLLLGKALFPVYLEMVPSDIGHWSLWQVGRYTS